MPSLRRPAGVRGARFVAASLGLVLALVSCSSDDPPTPEDRFGADTPAVASCRILTIADIGVPSNETPTVSCNSAHTAVTISVGGFPAASVTNENLTNGNLGDEALRRCTAAWRRTVGGDVSAQHTTVVGLAFYLPNQDQLGHGARWYRCDLVIGGQDGMPLRDLPEDVTGLLAGPLPDSLVACRTSANFHTGRQVSCEAKHVLRAVGTATLPAWAGYPTQRRLRSASERLCRSVVDRWLNGRFNGGIAYQWPDQVGWQLLGDRSATCWSVTTS